MQSFQQYRRGGYDMEDAGAGAVPAPAVEDRFFKKNPRSCSAVSNTSTATGRSESLMLVLYCKQLAQIRRTSVANAATLA
jgi:hypothetical protein